MLSQRKLSMMQIIQSIQKRIYEIRGERVMLDRDLAALYETETKRLKESVNRNVKDSLLISCFS
jgi:ORF6N domain